MKPDWKREIPALTMLAAMFVTALAVWPHMPDRLPVHWGLSGDPNRWGGRFEALLGLPLTALGVYVLLLVLPRIDPRREHYPSFAGPYSAIRAVLVGSLFALQLFKVVRVDTATPGDPRVLPMILGLLTVFLGNYLPKVQSNWFVGVRTPWTLSSEESWRRTHRLAGWLLVGTGLLSVLAAAVWPGAALPLFLVLLGISVVSSIVYSYVAWREDAGRTPPANLA